MAKSKSQAQVRVAARRQRASAPDDEGTNRRLVIGSIVLVVIAVIAIIAFGWWWSEIKPFNKTVLQVNSTTYSLNHVVRRMKLELKTNPSIYQGDARLLSQGVITQLEREGKLLAGAKKLNNIKVSDKDIDAKIRETGGLAATASPAEFVAELDRQVSDSGLKKDEYLQMLRAQLLDAKVHNYFTFVTPASEAQTRARWIVVSQESEANDALARLNAGEDFAAVAKEVSIDTQTSADGGELGWRVRGQLFVEDVEKFVFDDAKVGDRSDVISTPFGFYIVEVEQRADDRKLDAAQHGTVADRLTNEWYDSLDGTLKIKNNFTDEDEARALKEVAS